MKILKFGLLEALVAVVFTAVATQDGQHEGAWLRGKPADRQQ
jgi:hypothetical protein